MGYVSKDEQILVKIAKYISMLKDAYSQIKNLPDDEINDSLNGLALTQCITNLYELTIRIEDENVSDKLFFLSSGRVARLRNISAHDYDSVNWNIVKEVCRKIISQISQDLLNECLETLAQNKSQIKDYTDSLGKKE